MLGTRYKSYCSNVVRTLLVEPTTEMQANYDLLLRVEEDILGKLQHGLSLQRAVTLCWARLVLGWVTVSGVQLALQENLSQHITSHPGQLSLAIPPWAGK